MSAITHMFPALQLGKPELATATTAAAPAAVASTSKDASAPTESFAHGLLEIVNPLQHFPVVSTIYRQLTGDKIGNFERVAGDTLWGGPLGCLSSLANIAFEHETGKDFGDTVMSMLGLNGDDKGTKLAATDAATSTTASRASAASTTANPMASTVVASTVATPVVATAASSTAAPTTPAIANAQPRNLVTTFNLPSTTAASSAVKSNIVVPPAALVGAKMPTGGIDDRDAAALLTSMNKNGVSSDVGLRAIYAYRKTMGLPASTATAPAPQ